MSWLNKLLFWKKKKTPLDILKPENRIKVSEFYISEYKKYSRSGFYNTFYVIDSIFALIDYHKLNFPKIVKRLQKFVKKSKIYKTKDFKKEYYFNSKNKKVYIFNSYRPNSFYLKVDNSKITFLEIEKMLNTVKNKISI